MNTQRRSSSRRKALADCTNTIAAARQKFSPSAAKSAAGPPKPAASAAAKLTQGNAQPKPLTSNGSVKTNTSTGSNTPPIVDSALSIPRPSSDHLVPRTTVPDSASKDHEKIATSTAQNRKDEKTRMDKGNMSLGTSIIQASKLAVRQAPLKSSSTAAGMETLVKTTKRSTRHVPMKSSSASSGHDHLTDPPTVQNKKLESAKMKDSGKVSSEIPVLETTGLSRPHAPVASSPAASSESHLSGLPAVQDQQPDVQKRNDKGKEVLEMPIIEITDPFIPHISQASSSAASDNWRRTGSSAVLNQNQDAQTRSPAVQIQKMDAQKWKDKGKTVLDTSNTETAEHLRPHKSHALSSAIQNEKPGAQKRMDKRKSVAETQNLETTDPWILQDPSLSSSTAVSGSRYLLETPMAKYRKTDVAKSNDKRKMVQDASDIEATDHSTPQAPMPSLISTGTRVQEKSLFLTVYGQGRTPRRRTWADGKSTSFSCPPSKRAKKIGMEAGDGHGKKKSGSYTDPMHKKSRKNQDEVHVMPRDEIEKLRAYYAEIDEFELPEEVASDSD